MQRTDLLWRHHPIRDAEQDDGDAVVVGCTDTAARHFAGAQIPQRPRQIAVPAERQDERDVVANRRPRPGHDRETTGEADADHPDTSVGGIAAARRQPERRVLDHVGRPRRDAVRLQVRQFGSDDGASHRGDVSSELHQSRLVDAAGMNTGHEQDRRVIRIRRHDRRGR